MDMDEAIEQARPQPAAYVISCDGGAYLYKGACRDLKRRLRDHHWHRVSRTKNRTRLSLAYAEYCEDFTEARRRESFLKSGQGRAFLRQHLGK